MQPNSYNTITTVTDNYLQLFIMLCSPSSVIIQHQLNISWRRLAPQLNQKYAQHVKFNTATISMAIQMAAYSYFTLVCCITV